MKVVVTGGCGFIGSNFVRLALETRPAWRVINYDLLTYAGNPENLADVAGAAGDRYRFVRGDVADKEAVQKLFEAEQPDAIVNFAAESHVDRSIKDPVRFVRTNTVGTQVLLTLARELGVKRFLQVSTDEVYGSLGPTGKFTEQTPLAPNSPYAASKAAADLLCRAARHTFGQDVVVTRCSNNYGPYQFPEKLIPLMLSNAMSDQPLPVYGDGQHVRDWLHVRDHCEAVALVLERGVAGEVYNIGGNNEWKNLDLVRLLLKLLGKPESLIRFVPDRPGHDRRYAIDCGKIERELGWRPRHTFEAGLSETIAWYQTHRGWWERIKSGEYRKYYAEQYATIAK
ncbi:MAG: dTDP-glucose 4,6-dehydratase [Verrucomicrobiae bacterium]|nr:dTDP-glucose 4,6-dehydratase [Verrucomicrobiae bacterium]